MPSIVIDRRNKTLYYFLQSILVGGPLTTHGEPVKIPSNSSFQLKGETAIQTLARSPDVIPRSLGHKWMAQTAEAAGVKSWGAYLRGRLTIHVTSEQGVLSIRWFKKSGHRGGSSSERDWVINLSDQTCPEDIGTAIDQAFENCKS